MDITHLSQTVSEEQRLEALRSYQTLDSLEEKDFDELTLMASAICQVPISLISLVDAHRQWFKSHHGLEARETPIAQSFCAHAIAAHEPIMVVEDAHQDNRFKDNPLVTGFPYISFYAGVPLINPDGFALGTLCVIDREKRTLTPEQQNSLKILARQVMDKLELKRNVVALQQTEQQLQSTVRALIGSESLLNLAIKSAGLGLWRYHPDQPNLFVSETCRTWFGFSAEEPVTLQQMIDSVSLEYRPPFAQSLREAMQTGEQFRMEYPITHPRSTVKRWMQATGIYVPAIRTFVGMFQETTLHKETEKSLQEKVRERTRELEQSNEDLMQFAHVASHDLQEPVRKIRMFGSRLLEEMPEQMPARGQQYLQKILQSAGRMADMIRGVLEYSKLQYAPMLIEKVKIRDVILQICNDLELPLQEKKATIIIGELPEIQGSPVQLHQLFYNLMINALKFTSEERHPEIRINSRFIQFGDMDFVEFDVADNGIGFEQEDAARIFGTFIRLNAKDRFEGTGIGLSICRKIADRHHGEIMAHGRSGQGAVFTVRLPLSQTFVLAPASAMA